MAKTILLTGASKGLGLECARVLLQNFGCNVVALSRSLSEELAELQSQHEQQLEIVQGDVSIDADQKRAVDAAVNKYKQLDGLILNAGTLDPVSRIADAHLADFKKCFDVNFFSLVSILQNAIPHLRKSQGKVIFTSSGAATGNYTAWGAYNSSKAALNSLCRTVAAEEADITFVAVRPGVLATQMQDEVIEKGRGHMTEIDFQRFVDIRDQGKRVPPRQPGFVIASLAVKADRTLSGQFVNWSEDAVSDHQESTH